MARPLIDERFDVTEAFLNKLAVKCPTVAEQLRLRHTKRVHLTSSPYRCCLHFDFELEHSPAHDEFDRHPDGHACKVLEGDRASFMKYFGLSEADMAPVDDDTQT